METKVMKKFFGLADFVEEQEFLQKQHKAGWKLKTFKALKKYTFEKCEPVEYIYQLDFNEEGKYEEAYIQMFEDCGWEYIMKYQKWYYFRKAKCDVGENDNSIFSDAESKIDMCKKVYKTQGIAIFPLLAVISCWNVLIIPNIDNISIWLIIGGSLCIILIVFFFGMGIANFSKLNKMIKEIQNPLDTNEKK
ncbi:DUF2812 domain-containing protein [Clostridium bowmanii]|uniref:DUF2812 domain-containing protein n=1 Tax=Clostridium bowmanii TaxID=132925 RepID=UPI001C0B4204|nr:DUF2812 domain-containing protein [Clostridium bowmanii]MBU3189577.1 DUF2812 domain-containing protein [Clostridium bowmanii]MCA1073580.1 DUF2812 domain-containing protein [Clostridium bowmanii]